MNEPIEIRIAKEFGKTLGARYKYEGKFSGELFLEMLLLPRFNLARQTNTAVKIYLDDVYGYPSSFVSGSFGKLSIDFTSTEVLNHIDLITDNSIRREKIIKEIKNPTKKDPIKS